TSWPTWRPSSNSIRVGIDMICRSRWTPGAWSTSTFANVTLSEWAPASSSMTGAIILHGPHHVAQKSTRTGLLLSRTSDENESSVTVIVEDDMGTSDDGGGSDGGGDGGGGVLLREVVGRRAGAVGVRGEPAFGFDGGGTAR